MPLTFRHSAGAFHVVSCAIHRASTSGGEASCGFVGAVDGIVVDTIGRLLQLASCKDGEGEITYNLFLIVIAR